MDEKTGTTIAYVAIGVLGIAAAFGMIGLMSDGMWVSPLMAMVCGYALFVCAALVLVGLSAQTVIGRLLILWLLGSAGAAEGHRLSDASEPPP